MTSVAPLQSYYMEQPSSSQVSSLTAAHLSQILLRMSHTYIQLCLTRDYLYYVPLWIISGLTFMHNHHRLQHHKRHRVSPASSSHSRFCSMGCSSSTSISWTFQSTEHTPKYYFIQMDNHEDSGSIDGLKPACVHYSTHFSKRHLLNPCKSSLPQSLSWDGRFTGLSITYWMLTNSLEEEWCSGWHVMWPTTINTQ